MQARDPRLTTQWGVYTAQHITLGLPVRRTLAQPAARIAHGRPDVGYVAVVQSAHIKSVARNAKRARLHSFVYTGRWSEIACNAAGVATGKSSGSVCSASGAYQKQ